uniref:Uncharacterized protein n=1 Tax=Timema poppense TaxID=170557 RepID=A0A7R9D5Q2_TIMPO|nr:unnamed protein product [Timema poppensis]
MTRGGGTSCCGEGGGEVGAEKPTPADTTEIRASFSPVLGSLTQHETSALANYANEAGPGQINFLHTHVISVEPIREAMSGEARRGELWTQLELTKQTLKENTNEKESEKKTSTNEFK